METLTKSYNHWKQGNNAHIRPDDPIQREHRKQSIATGYRTCVSRTTLQRWRKTVVVVVAKLVLWRAKETATNLALNEIQLVSYDGWKQISQPWSCEFSMATCSRMGQQLPDVISGSLTLTTALIQEWSPLKQELWPGHIRKWCKWTKGERKLNFQEDGTCDKERLENLRK